MPAFYIIVVLMVAFIWLSLSSLYWPLGHIIKTIFKDSYDAMTEEDKNEKEN